MGKGSGRRPKEVTDEDLEEAWNRIFNSKPASDQFELHKQKVAWRDEMVKENHEKSIKDKSDGSITDTKNIKEVKK